MICLICAMSDISTAPQSIRYHPNNKICFTIHLLKFFTTPKIPMSCRFPPTNREGRVPRYDSRRIIWNLFDRLCMMRYVMFTLLQVFPILSNTIFGLYQLQFLYLSIINSPIKHWTITCKHKTSHRLIKNINTLLYRESQHQSSTHHINSSMKGLRCNYW